MDEQEMKKIEFLPTKRGCNKAIYDGRQYHLTKTYVNGNKFWKCNRSSCKRSITTDINDIVVRENPHKPDCPQDKAKYHIKKKLEDLKNRVCRNNEPILIQYERIVCELEDSGISIAAVPKFSSVKTALYDARKRHLEKRHTDSQRGKGSVKRKSFKPTKVVADFDESKLDVDSCDKCDTDDTVHDNVL